MASRTRTLREKRKKVYDGIDDDDIDGMRRFDVIEKLHSNAYNADFVIEMTGTELTVEYFQRSGNKFPIIMHDKTGIGLRTPSDNFRVSDVKKCVGSRRMLDVMDVDTQTGLEMSLKEWEAYYENPVRERLLNVISLEFSHTRLDQYVDAPSVVRQIDFINNSWPQHLKECHNESTNILEKMLYPKVQKYCLMSVGNCYTDFHIDFGGTSVWYHILRGQKVFWLIEPTDENLDLYVDWVLSGKQGDIFFADRVSKCQKVFLQAGDTFMIPSGWIHSVYTPVDSLVFGGNFLHSYNLVQQLKVSHIEDRTRVPNKFRFPFFTEMMWYVLAQYVRCLTGQSHFILPDTDDKAAQLKPGHIHITPFELEGLTEVVDWLENLPSNKKCIPRHLEDTNTLLERTKDMLIAHSADAHAEAVTGLLPISWPESMKKTRRSVNYKEKGIPKSKIAKVINVNRRRRTRCKKCEACLRDDCRECGFCQDMKKFGGAGKMKQSCKSRRCMAPTLPNNAHCIICGDMSSEGDEDNYDFMILECTECWDITHPACLHKKMGGVVANGGIGSLPNSWLCSRCVQPGNRKS